MLPIAPLAAAVMGVGDHKDDEVRVAYAGHARCAFVVTAATRLTAHVEARHRVGERLDAARAAFVAERSDVVTFYERGGRF